MSKTQRGEIKKRTLDRPFTNAEGKLIRRVYDVVIRYPVDGQHGTEWKTFRRRSIESLAEARKVHASLLEKLNSGEVTPVRKGSLTAVEYIERVIAQKVAAREIRPNTSEGYERLLRKWIAPRIGTLKVEQLTTPRLQRLVRDLREAGLSPSYVRQALAVVEGACGEAVRDGVIRMNPAVDVKLPKLRKQRRKEFDIDEIRRVLLAAEAPWDDVFAFLAYTGTRRSEALGLVWDAVDLVKGRIHIRQGLHRIDGELKVQPPKSDTSERTIVLDEVGVAMMKSIKARQGERLLAMGARATGDTPVFDRDGTWRDPDSVSSAWMKLTKRMGVQGLRLHDLRHHYATLLVNSGVDYRTVADAMGHSSPSFTLATYVRSDAEQRRAANAEVSRRLGVI